MTLKIGIYDKYLATMGGGEKYVGLLAVTLNNLGHDVTIFTHNRFDSQKAKRLNLDLSKIKIDIIPESEESFISEYQKKFDVFINATFFSRLPNYSKYGIYLAFFPVVYNDRFPPVIKKTIFTILSILLNISSNNFTIIDGAYKEEICDRKRGFWTNGDLKIQMKNNLVGDSLIIDTRCHATSSLKQSKIQVYIDDTPIESEKLVIERSSIKIPANLISKNAKIRLVSKTFVPADFCKSTDTRRLGIFIFEIKDSGKLLKNKLVQLIRNSKIRTIACWLNDRKNSLTERDFINSYDKLITISKYSDDWSEKIWGRRGDLLYPPVDTNEFSPAKKKRNVIISVGRFFVGGHNKKHIPMIKAFRQMCDEGLHGWELHLCGGTHPEKENQEHLQQIMELSEGYPIKIFPDILFKDLKKEYSIAKIYWHAGGYGENANKNPDKFEHFGITTVEAMAAGAVPVVIDMAGQKETVEQNVSGFRWHTLDELKSRTQNLINNPELLRRMSVEAISRSKKFNTDTFRNTVREIFKSVKRN